MHYLSTKQRLAIRMGLIGAAIVASLAAVLVWPRLDHVIEHHTHVMLIAALALVAAGAAAYKVLLRYQPTFPSGFQATVHHRNIALDHASGLLWVRTPDAREYTLSSDQIRTWKHEWTHHSNRLGWQRRACNRLVFELSETGENRIGVDFGHDHAAASQWQARIAYWKQRDLYDMQPRHASL